MHVFNSFIAAWSRVPVCWSFWLPCLPFAWTTEIVDRGSDGCCLHCFLYILCCMVCMTFRNSGWNRKKLRERYRLQESPLPDRLLHFCCHSCALAQEYRELAARGFDVKKGWRSALAEEAAAAAAPARKAPGVQIPMNRANK